MDEVGKLDRILNEEDGDIVADNVCCNGQAFWTYEWS